MMAMVWMILMMKYLVEMQAETKKIILDLKENAEKKGFTYYKLAKMLGVNHSQVSRVFNFDTENPSLDLIVKMMKELEVKTIELK